ncbi:MAG: dephospho-CoA kinase [Lachnospiraceae bacterium]|nr:dephospho-CoA kinase [Lachnospiraceae bacterium]
MVIGITGGVGCGKSAVMKILEKEYHAHIIIADEMGHEVMEPGGEAFDTICREFGREILLADSGDGEKKAIDRQALAALIYGDDKKREKLNAIIHPLVLRKIQDKLRQWQEEPLVVIETAILFETGCDALCDEVWGVFASRQTRLERLITSRGYTEQKAISIMEKQLSDEELAGRCHRRIENDGSFSDLYRQLRELLLGTEEKI